MTVVLLVLIAAVAWAESPQAPAAASSEGVHVSEGRIVDGEGRALILRGVNAMDKVRGADGDLDPDLTDADLTRIASIGFNVLRLGTSWAATEPSPGHYDDAFITRFRSLMDRVHSHDLLVVVDMHQDVWGEAMGGNGAPGWAGPQCNVPPHVPLAQTTGQWFMDYFSPDSQAAFSNFWADGSPDVFCTGGVQTRFVEMWAHLAAALRGHPALAGYDLLNEPWPGLPPGAFEAAQLYPFYGRLVRAIREADATTPIFFEPPISKSANIPALPAGPPDPNAVYAPHMYTETTYSGGSFTTGARTDSAMAAEDGIEAAAMDVPYWIGEWGAFENAASAGYQRRFYSMLDDLKLGAAYWHYTQGYNDGLKVRPPSADEAHLRVYPEAYPGDASWVFDPESAVFRMTLNAGPDAQPAVLVVPSRLYSPAPRFAGQGTVVYDPTTGRAEWRVPAPGVFSLEVRPQ